MAVIAEQKPAMGTTDSAPEQLRKLNNPRETWMAIGVVAGSIGLYWSGMYWYDESLYNAEEGFGYWLGLIGGVFMLIAYTYSLRKYMKALRFVWVLRKWLRLHIFMGITGPFLIIPHTTFELGSPNSTIAFVSMALVMLSGVIGRYLYSKVHFGLNGKRARLQEVQALIGLDNEEGTQSVLASIPAIKAKLERYEQETTRAAPSTFAAIRMLYHSAWTSRKVYWDISRKLRHYLAPFAQQQRWDANDLAIAVSQTREMLGAYIGALKTVAKFKAYDQLFALWRVVHVPLLFLLMISGLYHVLMTHMY
jgi:hypothetical protein